MRIHPLLIAAVLCTQAAIAATPKELIAEQVPQARAILDAWKKGSPTDTKRVLHVIYWTPADREPAPQYRERLTRVMDSIQKFYATEMNTLGFGEQTINLDHDQDKLLRIHVVKAPNPYAFYKPNDGAKIREECLPTLAKAGINADKETILIFCNMANWDAEKMLMSQNSPYYASGTHRNGTAWQVDSPLIDPNHLDKKQPMIHDGQYGHISVGKYNSIFVGGVAHELGHALGLPHNCERADERAALGIALMGNGNRTYGRDLRGEGKPSFLTLASGLRCASHPMFTGSVKGMELSGQAELTDLTITKGDRAFSVTGKVTRQAGSPPVYAVLAYTDPIGGSNYDATTGTAVPDKDGKFTLHCTGLSADRKAMLRLIILYANGDATSHAGSYTPYTFPYSVDKNGQANLDEMDLTFIFAPVQRASAVRNNDEVARELKRIASSNNRRAAAIATRLLNPGHAHKAPAVINTKLKQVALADTTPDSATVGYFRPMYNRLPNSSQLLMSDSQIFTHGIYAHAPASHRYNIGAKWKRLSGKCGIADGTDGSVRFTIMADGKEVWKSQLIQPGRQQAYQLDLTGVQKLEFMVDDGGNGNGSDWGLWLEPLLSR